MINFWKKILIGSVLIAGVALNSQAGVITYSLPDVDDFTRSDSVIPWFTTSIITEEVESFTLSFDWADQGWGNYKGRIYYSSGDSGWLNLGLLAEHDWVNLSQSIFSSSLNDFDVAPLNFAYVVGGGGGHSLHIKDAVLSITSVPEPLSLGLLCLGIAGFSLSRRKAKAKAKA